MPSVLPNDLGRDAFEGEAHAMVRAGVVRPPGSSMQAVNLPSTYR